MSPIPEATLTHIGLFVHEAEQMAAFYAEVWGTDLDGSLAAWRAVHPNVDVVVVRPDRYVAAACRTGAFASHSERLSLLMQSA